MSIRCTRPGCGAVLRRKGGMQGEDEPFVEIDEIGRFIECPSCHRRNRDIDRDNHSVSGWMTRRTRIDEGKRRANAPQRRPSGPTRS